MSTLAQLETMVATWLDDPNFGYFTRPQVDVWLNNAQAEVQKQLLQAHVNFYLTPVQTTLVVNQNDYVLPIDFMTEHRLEIVMSGTQPNESVIPLAPITLNQQDLVPNQTGTPQFYYLKKNRIRVHPAPDTALTMRMYYSYLVGDMVNSTDQPDIPPAYHELLAVMATMDGLLKDGRSIMSMQEKIKHYIHMMKKETDTRTEDAPRSIVSTGGDMSQMFGFF